MSVLISLYICRCMQSIDSQSLLLGSYLSLPTKDCSVSSEVIYHVLTHHDDPSQSNPQDHLGIQRLAFQGGCIHLVSQIIKRTPWCHVSSDFTRSG